MLQEGAEREKESMNKEVIKAMNKKETKKDTFRKWWNKNGYKVLRVIFFPVWGACVAKEKITKWFNNRTEWSEVRAKQILDYYIPRRAEWDSEDKEFYFFDNGFGWGFNLAKKYLKRKDYRFWKLYACGCFGSKMRTFLIEKYELEGFTKEVRDCHCDWTEIIFTMN